MVSLSGSIGACWATVFIPCCSCLDQEVNIAVGVGTLPVHLNARAHENYRLSRGWGWWADEQPSPEIKARVEASIEQMGWMVDVVLSHTTPLKYEPVEVFLPGIDQSKVDKSTEEWLDSIEERLDYKKWYCGHYHTEKKIDRLQIMFNDYAALEAECLC